MYSRTHWPPDAGRPLQLATTLADEGLMRVPAVGDPRPRRHLILLLEELRALGVDFVSIAEGIDATTPAGRLQMHILGAIAEFERARIAERVRAGLSRARRQGKKLGRPRRQIARGDLERTAGLSSRSAAKILGVSATTLRRLRVEASRFSNR